MMNWASKKHELFALQNEQRIRNAQKSLHACAKWCWPVLEPNREFKDNWHLHAICEHLEAVTNGEIQNLVINLPPRHMKSTLIAVVWPVWEWLQTPYTRWLFSSYAENLSKRDSVKCRRLIFSPQYQVLRPPFELTGDQNEKMRFENNQTGYRIATSVGGAGTGEGGDRIVCDDPHKARDIYSKVKRESVLEWWDEEMSSRGNDSTSAKVIVMQRLHAKDLSGHVLASETGYDHLCLPAEFDGKNRVTSLLWTDPREKKGEVLWKSRFDHTWLETQKKTMGSRAAMAQLQQDPTSEEGAIIKKAQIKFYTELPKRFHQIIQSWDLTFKKTNNSDFVAGQVWGRSGADKYLLDRVRERMDINETMEAILAMRRKHPKAIKILIEDKANGPAVIDILKKKISGLTAVNPDSDKVSRLYAVSPQFESGNVWLPHPDICAKVRNEAGNLVPWVNIFIEELVGFPNAEHDDEVDACSQALSELEQSSSQRFGDLITL